MDCCNYMQYRHPYYGPQFYENGLYNRDYYGHPYQSYYANSHYYSQQWPCAASFPDYVYNPKEARIRKAMREASRERVVGTAPIPSPRGGRRSQTWTSNPEEQLMMAPSPDLGGPLCGSPIFPGPNSGVGQFMPPLNSYTKLVHVLPSNGWLPSESPTYLQHNPMAELQQHQANMWHQYQEPMRPCSGPTYMMDSQVNLYQEVNPHDVLPQKKCKPDVDAFSNGVVARQHHHQQQPVENPPPPPPPPASKSDGVPPEKVVKHEKMEENKDAVDDAQTLVDTGNHLEQSETFLPVFQETILVQNPFDKDDDVKLKKRGENCNPDKTFPNEKPEGPPVKQCPPPQPFPIENRAAPAAVNSDFRDCHRNTGAEKSVCNCYNCAVFTIPSPLFRNPCNLDMFLMDNCNPNLIYTDVGIIPMYDNNLDVDAFLNNMSNVPVGNGLSLNNGNGNATVKKV